jgi:hypothetical protein
VSVQAVDASQRAFVYALQYGLRLGSAVALVGAVLAWTLIASRKAARQVQTPPQDAQSSTSSEPTEAQSPTQSHPAEAIGV